MIVARNAQEQWVLRCAAAAGMKGYSTTDLLVLHMVGYGPKRLADICFSLNIEDTHIVSYALKKLQRAKLVESSRIGKDTFFEPSAEGRTFVDDYKTMRKRFLIRALAKFSGGEVELEQLAEMLRVLSGLYEQAARSAENSMAV
jgi:predicted MarR family transcription regulator